MFGCDSLVITTTSLLPSDTTILQASNCDPAQVGITQELQTNIYGCDSLIVTETSLLPSDTTWILLETCLPTDTGMVAALLTNQYGCDSLVLELTALMPPSECQLSALILGDTIGCQETEGSLLLTFLDGTPPYTYTWTDQSGNTGSGLIDQTGQQQVTGLPPGTYTFDILDPDGLMITLTANIFQPDPLEIVLLLNSDFNGYGISCYGATDGSASVEILAGGLPPYSISWSNGSQSTQANGLAAGWTTVTVTDATSCIATESILLESPDSLQFSLSVAQPECFDEGLGAIGIEQVEGGNEPYQYSLNGNDWQDNPLFGNLSAGSYLLEVEDANDCLSTSFAFINSLTELIVDIGPDTVLQYGDSMQISPLTNLPVTMLDSIYWGGLDCPGCPDVMVAPVAASAYSVTIVDSLGCEASDDLNINVRKDFKYYIPNSFSPNLDGINDRFMIYSGKHVVKVHELQIFDRWGEPVFTYFNFPPNDPTYGWDGTHRGEYMNPAVFVYFTVLEFVDGSTKLVKGNVMLVR